LIFEHYFFKVNQPITNDPPTAPITTDRKVEAFNLKAAIEYSMSNMEMAKEALSDMPPREEQELDPVTLHNQALIGACL
jgi:hypothetical protein